MQAKLLQTIRVSCSVLALTLSSHALAQTSSYTSFGTGCPGSMGVPLLEADECSLPLLGETFRARLTNVPDGIAIGILGRSTTDWLGTPLPLDLSTVFMPGCTLFTDLKRTKTLVIAGGQATWDTLLPSGREFLGASFIQQVFVPDASVPGLGAVMSNAAKGVVGIDGSVGSGPGIFPGQMRRLGSDPFSVVLGDVNGDGWLDAVSANRVSDDISLLLGDGAGGFELEQRFAVGTGPRSIALGDVNGDGWLDAVSANRISDDISLLLGDGAGGFELEQRFAVGTGPRSIALGDVNGDGRVDAVTTNFSSDDVSVLLGVPIVGFGVEQRFAIPVFDSKPRSVVLGDVSGDGNLDIVGTSIGTVFLLLGDGAGGFGVAQSFIDGGANDGAVIALGDVDRDGWLDAVIVNQSTDQIVLLLGDGAGSFSPLLPPRFTVGSLPTSVALGDLNGDGWLDVVVTNSGFNPPSSFSNVRENDISVLLGDGAGSFGVEQRFVVGGQSFPQSVALGDVNGDGWLDAMIANRTGGNRLGAVSWLLGDGAGGFVTQQVFAASFAPGSLALGDVDGDGWLDAVTANGIGNEITLLLGDGAGGFGVEQRFGIGSQPLLVALGDVNGDGWLDAVTLNSDTFLEPEGITLLLGDGAGGFAAQKVFAASDTPSCFALGDLNGDGCVDAVVTNQHSSNISVLLGDPLAPFGIELRMGLDGEPTDVALGDVNGDGNLDAVIDILHPPTVSGEPFTYSLSLLIGDGAGSFGVEQCFEPEIPVRSLLLDDVNGDGWLDAVGINSYSVSYPSNLILLLLGDGAGGFGAEQCIGLGDTPFSLALGDVNGDGWLDAVMANNERASTLSLLAGTVSIMIGDGAGGFREKQLFRAGVDTRSLALGDLNGDGWLDAVTTNTGTQDISTLLNQR